MRFHTETSLLHLLKVLPVPEPHVLFTSCVIYQMDSYLMTGRKIMSRNNLITQMGALESSSRK